MSATGPSREPGFRPTSITRRALMAGAFQGLALLAACTVPLPVSPPAGTRLPGSNGADAGPSQPPSNPAPGISGAPTAPVSSALTSPLPVGGEACRATAVVVPTVIPYPGYSRMEASTGLHVTGEAQPVDLAAWRLRVTGKAQRPLVLTYDELRCLPKVGAKVRLDCPGFFTDWSNLAGPTIAAVLGPTAPLSDARTVLLRSVDGRVATLGLEEAMATENFLAYEWESQVLPPSHGFPVRAVLPGEAGGNWIKWLVEIEIS